MVRASQRTEKQISLRSSTSLPVLRSSTTTPIRPMVRLNWQKRKRDECRSLRFINGQSYMEAVARGILAAREEIFITDWWLSPEILLVRPWKDDSMRLDNLLGRRAVRRFLHLHLHLYRESLFSLQEEGIRVYVMIFKDIVQVVGLNSWHTKVRLMSKSPKKKNIKVIRHPDHRVLPGTESSFLYSHHEKTVVIDQRIAFIGGIDLCWGRWDTDKHRSHPLTPPPPPLHSLSLSLSSDWSIWVMRMSLNWSWPRRSLMNLDWKRRKRKQRWKLRRRWLAMFTNKNRSEIFNWWTSTTIFFVGEERDSRFCLR